MKWMGAASRLAAAVVLSFVATSAFAYGKKHAKSYVTSAVQIWFLKQDLMVNILNVLIPNAVQENHT